MSESAPVGPEKTVPAKKPISPARNIIGLIILVAVVVVGVIEYSAYFGHRWAASALKARVEQEEKDLMTVQEAESLLGKAPDGPPVDFKAGSFNFWQKTYSWRGLLKQHTLTAYYTKEKEPRLHHYETDGEKFDLPNPATTTAKKKGSGGQSTKEASGKTGGGPSRAVGPAKNPPDSTTPASTSADKASTPKPSPPGGPAPTEKPAVPSDKGSAPAPAADQPPAKSSQ
jgi:hypothetical protein